MYTYLSIMLFDVLKVGRILERRNIPVQMLQPLVDIRVIISDSTNIALKMLNINRIKANNGRIKSDIGFGKPVPEEVRAS